MQNTSTAHQLEHWRFSLHEWVTERLESEGYLDAEEVERRERRWSARKKARLAGQIFDEMDGSGEVKRIHAMFKATVKAATDEKNEYRGFG